MACALLCACAGPPPVEQAIAGAEARGEPVVVTGPDGNYSAAASAALLKKAGVPKTWLRQLSVEQGLNDTSLVAGNALNLLVDGDETFDTIFRDIEAARRNINLEYYIFENVRNDGKRLSDLLLAKRRRGVTINVIYDEIGSSATPPAFIDKLRAAGVNIVVYAPLEPYAPRRRYAPNYRDHRKMLIVDGAVAVTGGVNVSRDYESGGSGHSGAPEHMWGTYWHDTALEVRGPAVGQLQELFFQHWEAQNGPPLDKPAYFPRLHAAGNELVRVIGSRAGKEPHFYMTLLSAIRNAHERIWLTAAYFVPSEEEVQALLDARARGVDVRLLLPDRTDSGLATVMQRSFYKRLLRGGVRVFETHGEVLHSKTIAIDGVWSVVGSSNFDQRSVVYNDEVDVVIPGRRMGAELERMFVKDTLHAQEVTKDWWKRRALIPRMRDAVESLWAAIVRANL